MEIHRPTSWDEQLEKIQLSEDGRLPSGVERAECRLVSTQELKFIISVLFLAVAWIKTKLVPSLRTILCIFAPCSL